MERGCGAGGAKEGDRRGKGVGGEVGAENRGRGVGVGAAMSRGEVVKGKRR